MGRILTGVSGHICAAHLSPEGVLHGHTWTVRAWWVAGGDARDHLAQLDIATAAYCHTLLPAACTSGETIAAALAEQMPGCVAVEVFREPERIFARWEA